MSPDTSISSGVMSFGVKCRIFAEKLALTTLVFGFFLSGYFLLGRMTLPRAHLFPWVLPGERHLPLVPEMVYFYVLAFVLPDFALFGWPLADRSGMRRQALAYGLLHLTCFLTFYAYPVYADLRPPSLPPGDLSLSVNILRHYYAMDPPVNLFPSLHCGNAVLSALMARRIPGRPGRRRWMIAVTAPLSLMVLLSVVLLKQHYVADVVAGTALALFFDWLCFRKPATIP